MKKVQAVRFYNKESLKDYISLGEKEQWFDNLEYQVLESCVLKIEGAYYPEIDRFYFTAVYPVAIVDIYKFKEEWINWCERLKFHSEANREIELTVLDSAQGYEKMFITTATI